MSVYIVKQGEDISDCVLNATGDISNWEVILNANSFSDWNPAIIIGQSIIIPDSLVKVQANVLRNLQIYPACNNQ